MLQWSEEFSVRIQELDAHHRHLFSILNRLREAMGKGNNARIVLEVLTELEKYASYHFQAEEELFRKKNYPEAPSHIREHDVFRENLRRLDALVKQDNALAGLELSQFLSSWFTAHILTTDMKYVSYLAT